MDTTVKPEKLWSISFHVLDAHLGGSLDKLDRELSSGYGKLGTKLVPSMVMFAFKRRGWADFDVFVPKMEWWAKEIEGAFNRGRKIMIEASNSYVFGAMVLSWDKEAETWDISINT